MTDRIGFDEEDEIDMSLCWNVLRLMGVETPAPVFYGPAGGSCSVEYGGGSVFYAQAPDFDRRGFYDVVSPNCKED